MHMPILWVLTHIDKMKATTEAFIHLIITPKLSNQVLKVKHVRFGNVSCFVLGRQYLNLSN